MLDDRKALAEALAGQGRRGDDQIGHLTTDEVVLPLPMMQKFPELLQAFLDAAQKMGVDPGRFVVGGGDDSINPDTGMPEFGLDSGSYGNDGAGPGADDNTGDTGGYGGSDNGGWQTGAGFAGSPEIGPNHGRQIDAAFAGEPNTYGGGPEEIGGGNLSFMGFSPARYQNPMRSPVNGERFTEYGVGFNPGRAIGGILGGLAGGPLGGLAGSIIGGKMANTRFSGFGYGEQPAEQARPERDGNRSLIQAMLDRGIA